MSERAQWRSWSRVALVSLMSAAALTVAAWPPLVLSDRAEDGVVAVVVMRDGQILGMKTKPPEKKLEDAPGDTLTPPADSGPK